MRLKICCRTKLVPNCCDGGPDVVVSTVIVVVVVVTSSELLAAHVSSTKAVGSAAPVVFT